MNEIEEIKNRLDIVEYIGRMVSLKKAGRNYKGLCPFHNEKTSSFVVSPEKQIFHCFGCNEGGDIFAYIMKVEGMEFVEALKKLADDAGVTLTSSFDPGKKDQREKLFEINEKACEFFEANLQKDIGKTALKYLENRKLMGKLILEFRIGYAPGGNLLTKKLLSEGYSGKELISAGVSKEKNGQIIDQFRNRVTFPFINTGERAVGFTARVLDDSLPKYINTSSTDIYDKSSILYGIFQAKEAIRKQDHSIIVEGAMDVLASHQAGVKNAVASGGTALTEGQLNLLKKFSSNIKLAFDIDPAGNMATKRAVSIAYDKEMNVKVIEIPEGKDAAEVVAKDLRVWQKAVKEAQHVMDYMLEKLFTEETDRDILKKKKATKEFISYLSKMNDFVEKDHYIKKLAEEIKVDESYIRKTLEKSPLPKKEAKGEKKNKDKDFREVIEMRLLVLSLDKGQGLDHIVEDLSEDDFHCDDAKTLYKKLKIYYNVGKSFDLQDFSKTLEGVESRDLNVLLIKAEQELEDLDEETIQEEIFYLVKKIKKLNIQAERKALSSEIKEAEARKDEEWAKKLIKKMQELIKKEQRV